MPSSANTLPIQITNGSRVMPKAAGIESTANAMSASTIDPRQIISGVAPGITRRMVRTARFLPGSGSSPDPLKIFQASTSSVTPRM